MQDELAELLAIQKSRGPKSDGFKEELEGRGFRTINEFEKRIAQLQLKLGLADNVEEANPAQ